MLALEGGYVGPAVSESVVECLRVLLGDPHAPVSGAELERVPCKQAAMDITNTIANLVKQICEYFLNVLIFYSSGFILAHSEGDKQLDQCLPSLLP